MVGASTGVGRATAESLAAHGCRLLLATRDHDELATVAAVCRERGAASVDVTARMGEDMSGVRPPQTETVEIEIAHHGRRHRERIEGAEEVVAEPRRSDPGGAYRATRFGLSFQHQQAPSRVGEHIGGDETLRSSPEPRRRQERSSAETVGFAAGAMDRASHCCRLPPERAQPAVIWAAGSSAGAVVEGASAG